MIARKTEVVHTTDRFMKVIFTVIAVCLLWLSVKDTQRTYRLDHSGRVTLSDR